MASKLKQGERIKAQKSGLQKLNNYGYLFCLPFVPAFLVRCPEWFVRTAGFLHGGKLRAGKAFAVYDSGSGRT